MSIQKLKAYATACLSVVLVLFIVLFPKESLDAASRGINTWFNIVFPALLPFFIGAELLIGTGAVAFMGTLLQPLMKPLFNTPGNSSFVLAMSVTSGYPMGPKLISQLRQQRSITRIEGERMLSFCTTSGPLFMLGAVATGMYGSTALGVILLISHYLACIFTGLIFRFYKREQDLYSNKSLYNTQQRKGKILKSAFNSLYNARITDGRPFGKLLGDAVKDSVYTLLQIGGYIILFSVIINILDITRILDAAAVLIGVFLPRSLDTGLVKALVSGMFEITVGCQLGSEVPASLLHKTWIVCSVITWGGLSVHAQVASLLSNSDICIKPYIAAKSIQAVLAGIWGFILFRIAFPLAQTAFKTDNIPEKIGWLGNLAASGKLLVGLLGVMGTVALLCLLLRNLKVIKL